MDFIETGCTVTHEGKSFTSGGAFVSDTHIVGYVGKKIDSQACRAFTDWHGNTIGTIRLTASWATPQSHVSSRMYQAYAAVDGITYQGRTCGEGMSFRGKRVK